MKTEYFSKILALALICSALVLIALKTLNLQVTYQSLESWFQPNSNSLSLNITFAAIIAFEMILLLSRIMLGYFIHVGKNLNNWQFYILSGLVAISGISGIILSIASICLRTVRTSNATKT